MRKLLLARFILAFTTRVIWPSLPCVIVACLALPGLSAQAQQRSTIVRTPDGKPADKAIVVMADTRSIVSIFNGEIVKTDDVIFRRQTNSAGRVDLAYESRPPGPVPRRFAPQGSDSVLVVVHPSGFAQDPVHVEDSPRSHSARDVGTHRRNLPGCP